MVESTYTTHQSKGGNIIRGRSLEEFKQLIGYDVDELLNFIIQFNGKVEQFDNYFEIFIHRDCPLGIDSITSKIYHAKRVNRSRVDKMWRGHI